MDFKQASSRFKKANKDQDSAGSPRRPTDFAESYRLRARMVGVLIRDARQNANRTIEETARLLRVSPQQMEAWEFHWMKPLT